MRDLIARALRGVLDLLVPCRRGGRHSATHVSAPAASVPAPTAANPWSRPWRSPSKEEAAALFRRERTGVASVVDVSLLGTAMWVLAPDIVAGLLLGRDLPSGDRTQAPNPIVNS